LLEKWSSFTVNHKFSIKTGGMLNFRRINNVSDPLFYRLYGLYVRAFPLAERRSWEGIEHELIYEKRFHPHVLLQDDAFVGFFNYWTFERFFYIEHFAIDPNFQNQRIGTEAMEIFMNQVKLPIMLEVEMPTNSLAGRRIRFYERLGFKVLSHNYVQPPYEGTGFLLPVLMMSNDVHFANTHYEMIKETLYKEVYHYDFEMNIP